MEAIDRVKAKRKVIRSASTKFVNKVKSFLEDFDSQNETNQEQLFEYLLNLDDKQIELKTLNKVVEDLLSDEELFKAEIEGANESNVRTNNPALSLNLPKLQIPNFSGDSSTYLEFINCFTNAIDANESLNNVDKFIYLKSFLSGEASKIVSGFALTEDNYKSCLNLLKDRYGRQDHLISCFRNKLLEIEPVKSSFNLKGLRKLHDESEINIRNLDSMGVASGNYGHLLIPILLKQLLHDLVVEFHRQKDSKNIGDVKELMKFIKFEIESRESANIALGHSQKIPENSRYLQRNLSYQPQQPKFKNNFPSSSALTTVVRNVCIFCNSDTHTSIGCQIFSNEEKRYKLKKEGRCYRCMTYKHLISQCKVKITPCETCQSLNHNSLFCPKTKIKTPLRNNKTEIPEVDNVKKPETQVKEVVMSSVLNPQYSPENYATLLQTAEVQLINGCNKVI
ncbi:DUF1758 domain-containing protein [Trichonephila clavata]|uniref:DUF1758 domain-containing protein n=1 Tax=Trichonephila clavata TaxID=2740835 RepID=A0A8X6M659_TRICU|nr:DUF1758 domain-containing protein [Trichonephila clavata]